MKQQRKIKNFILIEKIGGGQFGQVWRGIDENTNTPIACKIVPKSSLTIPKLKELFITEVKYLGLIKNENVVGFIDYLESQNSCYVVMEYCDSKDLDFLIKKKKHLSEEDSVNYLKQILNGFKGLHENNIIHRDFKAANVFMHNNFQQVKIGDLGFAKQTPGLAQTVLGTPLYMAPEILNNQKYTNKSDVWSLGVVFYEMLFGCQPYNAGSEAVLIQQIKTQKVNYKKGGVKISADCQDLLEKMLTADPQKRIPWQEIYSHPLINQNLDYINMGVNENGPSQDIMKSICGVGVNLQNKLLNDKLEKNKAYYGQFESETQYFEIDKIQFKNKLVNKKKEESLKKNQQNQYFLDHIQEQVYSVDLEELDNSLNIQIVDQIEVQQQKRTYNLVKQNYCESKIRNEYLQKVINDEIKQFKSKEDLISYFVLAKKFILMNNDLLESVRNQQNCFNIQPESDFQRVCNSDEYKFLQHSLVDQTTQFYEFYNYLVQMIQMILMDQNFVRENQNIAFALQQQISPQFEINFNDFYQNVLHQSFGRMYEIAKQFEQAQDNIQAQKYYKFAYELLQCSKIDQHLIQEKFDDNNIQQLKKKIEDSKN